MTLQQPFSIMASEYLDKAWIKSGGFRAQFRATPEARETASKMVSALNAHDDLVKALEAARAYVAKAAASTNDFGETLNDDAVEHLAAIDAALAKAAS